MKIFECASTYREVTSAPLGKVSGHIVIDFTDGKSSSQFSRNFVSVNRFTVSWEIKSDRHREFLYRVIISKIFYVNSDLDIRYEIFLS